MRSPEQVKRDFVRQWLGKAESDLRSAEALLEADLVDYASTAFHAQQAAEKYMKAVLVQHQIEFTKTHDINRIRTLVARIDVDVADQLAPADALTPYAVEARYPGERMELPHSEGERAVELATDVREILREHLKPYLDT